MGGRADVVGESSNKPGRVISIYNGEESESDYITEASFIIKYMYKDPIGNTLRIIFNDTSDIDKFNKIINNTSELKLIPAELHTSTGQKVICLQSQLDKHSFIAIFIIGNTVEIARISSDIVISHLDIKTVVINEALGDRFNLRRYAEYTRRLMEIRLLRTLQIIKDTREGLIEDKRRSSLSPEMQEILIGMEEYRKSTQMD